MELIVYDDEFNDLPGLLESFVNTAEDRLSTYIEIMKEICGNAVSDGSVHDNLTSFTETAEALQGKIEEVINAQVTNSEAVLLRKYLEKIDIADQYLY